MKGMLASVYRNDAGWGDATNGGVTSKHKQVVLIGEGVAEVFAPSETAPALRLVRKTGYLYAEPVHQPNGVGWMFGGNFIYSSDSRFPLRFPIPVHDRQESREQYASYD